MSSRRVFISAFIQNLVEKMLIFFCLQFFELFFFSFAKLNNCIATAIYGIQFKSYSMRPIFFHNAKPFKHILLSNSAGEHNIQILQSERMRSTKKSNYGLQSFKYFAYFNSLLCCCWIVCLCVCGKNTIKTQMMWYWINTIFIVPFKLTFFSYKIHSVYKYVFFVSK